MPKMCCVMKPVSMVAIAAAILFVPAPDAAGDAARVTREDVFEFAQKPTIEKKGDAYVVTFASKGRCDVTVAVIDGDGKVVCYLASGVLGKNAPRPLERNSLSQAIEWDGNDNLGRPAPAGCRIRVGLGLKVNYAWTAPLLAQKDKGGKWITKAYEFQRSGLGEGSPQPDCASLSADEEKAWPKLTTPEGGSVLVPDAKNAAGVGVMKPGDHAPKWPGVKVWHNLRNQIVVDRAREEVYVGGTQRCFNTWWFRLDGKTGKHDGFKIPCMELAISPENGLLYVRDMRPKEKYKKDWRTHFLRRCDHDGKPVPFEGPSAGEDGEILLPSDPCARSFGAGMAFAPGGDLYIICTRKKWADVPGYKGHDGGGVFVFGCDGEPKPYRRYEYGGVMKSIRILDKDGSEAEDPGWRVHVTGACCAIGIDRYGDYCIGTAFRPVGKVFPEDLVGSPDLSKVETKHYRRYTGSVVKFSGKGARVTSAGEPTHWYKKSDKTVRIEGALWTYTGLTPITTVVNSCICTQGRLDVDGFGRVFVPQLHRQGVLVLDPNGNPVLRMGKYGSADVKMEGSDIRLAAPTFVGASDTALYIVDRGLGRVLKTNLEYHAEETVRVRP
jgi:hypothetical protein